MELIRGTYPEDILQDILGYPAGYPRISSEDILQDILGGYQRDLSAGLIRGAYP